MKELVIVKIGGNVIDDKEALRSFLSDFAAIKSPKILVHGGGKLATELSAKLGIETKMVDGRRITDEATLQVVTMTYAGWINKTIVAQLQSLGCNALGITGADGGAITAVKRQVAAIDYGFVGDVNRESVNTGFLSTILDTDMALIVAPIAADAGGTLLNVNADTMARVVTEALNSTYSTSLIYCFEKAGLLSNVEEDNSVISTLNISEVDMLKSNGTISKGMIPKVDNALKAKQSGAASVVIGHAKDLIKLVNNQQGYGTSIAG
ncbi:MAG TPA: acetylglutamate kinase [Chitinophagales bacterium]|nr:acetylglutamate kinase [Chitinophagales bacterium]